MGRGCYRGTSRHPVGARVERLSGVPTKIGGHVALMWHVCPAVLPRRVSRLVGSRLEATPIAPLRPPLGVGIRDSTSGCAKAWSRFQESRWKKF